MIMGNGLRASRDAAIAAALVIACGVSLSAHRRDEYLQAARIALAPDRLDIALDLTPGIAIADGVIAGIDRDGDGTASLVVQQAYVSGVARALAVSVDGQRLPLTVEAARFPALDSFRRGEGSIRLQLSAAMPRLIDGAHHLVFRNAHRPEAGAYLANALMPETNRVVITAQRRDQAQRQLTIDFVLQTSPAVEWPFAIGIGGVLAGVILRSRSLRGRARRVTAGARTWTILPGRLRTPCSR